MKKKFILNDTVIFEPEKNSLTSLHAMPVQKIILHTPASECLRQLLLHNDQVVSQKLLFEEVWEKNGAFVTVNTLYQNIVSVRKGLKAAGITEDVIKTLPKIGFKISVSVKEADSEIAIPPPDDRSITEEDNSKNKNLDKEHSRQPWREKLLTVNKTLFLQVLIVIFIIFEIWGVLYEIYPAGRSYYTDYHFSGKVNGCQLYSSYPGDEKSRDMFLLLLSHQPVQCQPNSVAYMTVNRMYKVSSVILCDKSISEDDAQCKSFLFRGAQDEK